MVRQFGFPVAVSGLPVWNILFAREPESDMDLDETDETADGSSPDEPEQPSGKRPLLLGLLVVVAATGVYLAMHPDLLMNMMGPETETVQAPTPPPAAPTKQAAASPAPSTSITPAAPVEPNPAPAPPTPATPLTERPAPSSPPVAPLSPASAASAPSPLFSEGQRVAVVPDPALPAAAVSLSGNAARTKPGPMVSPTAVLTVVDGELHDTVWVYAVRTPQGTTGWAAEKQLKAAKR